MKFPGGAGFSPLTIEVMKAKDVESAEKLYHQLQSTMIKRTVIGEHPIFRD
jgi:hypothetical protein